MSEIYSEVKWGNWVDTQDVVIGAYTVKQGERLYRHKHDISEYYYVISGSGYIYLNDRLQFLRPTQFLMIHPTVYHEVYNPFSKPLTILYVFPCGYFRDIRYLH